MTITTNKKHQRMIHSNIVALVYVSESELIAAIPDYSASWETEYPEKFKDILHGLGMNTEQTVERQDAVWHRNRLGKNTFCSRWVGNERHDEEWISSGYASKEAMDRSKNSSILDSLYRAKNLTKDAQDYLEYKDYFKKTTEEETE